MEKLLVLSEGIVKIEVKEEPCDTLEDHESIELKERIIMKSNVKAECDEQEELEPLATVFLDPEDVTEEEVAEENEDPLAMCGENTFVAAEEINEPSSPLGREFANEYPSSQSLAQLEIAVKVEDHPIHQKTSTESVVAQMQRRKERRQFECSFCQRRFSHKRQLDIHMRNHPAEECPVCQKIFANRGYLVKHLRTHTGEKPEECSVCQKRFLLGYTLVTHLRTHTGEKREKCLVCQKLFAERAILVRHMMTHTEEMPVECSVCQKIFANRGYLVKHLRTHTGEMPEVCPVCQKIFANRGYLVKHLSTHTGEKPEEC